MLPSGEDHTGEAGTGIDGPVESDLSAGFSRPTSSSEMVHGSVRIRLFWHDRRHRHLSTGLPARAVDIMVKSEIRKGVDWRMNRQSDQSLFEHLRKLVLRQELISRP